MHDLTDDNPSWDTIFQLLSNEELAGKNPNKLNYIYILTPKGVSEKTKLTINFMKKKMKEYDELKKELNE